MVEDFRKVDELRASLRRALENLPLEYRKTYLQDGPALGPEHIGNGTIFHSRQALVSALLSEGCVGAELGTQGGHWARFLADELRPRELHVVDIDLSQLEQDFSNDSNIQLWETESQAFLGRRELSSFDFIYIDASHWYPDVKIDTELSASRVKIGGLLIFNDYTTWSPIECEPYGVLRAINELLIAGGFRIEGFGLHPSGYPDVALRKISQHMV